MDNFAPTPAHRAEMVSSIRATEERLRRDITAMRDSTPEPRFNHVALDRAEACLEAGFNALADATVLAAPQS